MISKFELARSVFRGLTFCRELHCFSTSAARKLQPQTEKEGLWVSSAVQDIQPVLGVTIPEYVRANMGAWGNKPAFECFETGRKYTHDGVIEQSRGFGAALIQAGFKPGDVVAVVSHNIPEYCAILFGIWEAGLIATTINRAYTTYEIERQLLSSNARAVVTLPEYLPTIRKATESNPGNNFTVIVGEPPEGCHSYFEMVKTKPLRLDLGTRSQMDTLNDPALLLYSSGTTGPPKGVVLTHANIITNHGVLLRHPEAGLNIQECTETYQERVIGDLPFFHMYALWSSIISHMLFGAHLLVLPKFSSSSYVQCIKKHKPTTMFTVPPQLSLLKQHPEIQRGDLEKVKSIIVAAAPSGVELINPILEKFGDHLTFQEGFGMTEISGMGTLIPQRTGNKKMGSVGVPIPGTATKIVDTVTGKTLGRNLRGELCIKGPHVSKGYLNNEEATKNAIDPEDWFHSGDIGYYDDESYLYIVDRVKEIIKVNGFQVAPAELEDVLRGHPKVADVAVCGVPHARSGEAPRAYIVPKAGANLREEEILHFMREKVANFKQLQGVEFIQEIQKSSTGKILRKELVARYKEQQS